MPSPIRLEHAGGPAWVREPCGFDEQVVEEGGTPAVIALLDRVLVDAPGAAVGRGGAATLVASDRDMLLAELFRSTFGDTVRSTARCASCGERFDVEFSLADLATDARAQTEMHVQAGEETFALEDGTKFRLPTGDDECAVAGLPLERAVQELRERTVFAGDPVAAEEAMAAIAPLLERELELACPECGSVDHVSFELSAFLLGALAQERRQLAYEVHTLALAYGWGLDEILSLARSTRRAYVDLASGHARRRRS